MGGSPRLRRQRRPAPASRLPDRTDRSRRGRRAGRRASRGRWRHSPQEPVGQVLLWVIAVGFALLAVWQLTELVTQHEAFDKAKAGGKLVLYAALAWTSFIFASGGRTSSNKQTKDFTVTLMDAPAGQLLVGLRRRRHPRHRRLPRLQGLAGEVPRGPAGAPGSVGGHRRQGRLHRQGHRTGGCRRPLHHRRDPAPGGQGDRPGRGAPIDAGPARRHGHPARHRARAWRRTACTPSRVPATRASDPPHRCDAASTRRAGPRPSR